MAGELRAKDCYVGQRVFWVMWCDPSDTSEIRTGWYGYESGLSPEIWTSAVEHLPGNGSIMLAGYGRATNIYPREIDAVRGSYELFCARYLSEFAGPERCSLGEASRVLRELAELEFGINAWASSALSSTKWQMECLHGR